MTHPLLHTSARLYRWLLLLYPHSHREEFAQEMQYVFSEQLDEAFSNNGIQGLIILWGRTLIDAAKSIFIQHLETKKGNKTMKKTQTDLLKSNKAFGIVALVTALVLMVPLLGMQLSSEWNWSTFDFVFIGVLVFGAGSLFVFMSRMTRSTNQRILIGLLVLFAVMWLWAELAVGIFTNWGS